VELYLNSPNMPSWRGARLKRAQGLLYLSLYLIFTPQPHNDCNPATSSVFKNVQPHFLRNVIHNAKKCYVDKFQLDITDLLNNSTAKSIW